MSGANETKRGITVVKRPLRDAPLDFKIRHCETTLTDFGRLVNSRTTFDECVSLMELSTEGIDRATLEGVFNRRRMFFLDDSNKDHIRQIPALPKETKRVGLVIDGKFEKVLLRKEGKLWTLPTLEMKDEKDRKGVYDKVHMKGVYDKFLKKFSEVSYKDEKIGEGDEALAMRVHYFLDVDWVPPNEAHTWRNFNCDTSKEKDITIEARMVLDRFYKEYLISWKKKFEKEPQ